MRLPTTLVLGGLAVLAILVALWRMTRVPDAEVTSEPGREPVSSTAPATPTGRSAVPGATPTA
ncbi:MAG: hypothetical protein H0X17_15695, partial [Deltaproteobacteria bacterium]|nr:hypothetical protein [Deltaproteobacteria bacterium]